MAEHSILYKALLKPTSNVVVLPTSGDSMNSTMPSNPADCKDARAFGFLDFLNQQEPNNGWDQQMTAECKDNDIIGSAESQLEGSSIKLVYKADTIPWYAGSGLNHYITSRDTTFMRKRMNELGLLKGAPEPFRMTSDFKPSSAVPPGIEGASATNSPRSSRRKTPHVVREEVVDLDEEKRLKEGKKFIGKMNRSLIEDCDMVGTALYLSFGDIGSLTPSN